MNTEERKVMELALEALKFEDSGDPECEHGFMYDECSNDKCDKRQFHEAIKALEEALASEQEQRSDSEQLGEPVTLKPCGYASAEKKMCRKCGQVHAEAIFDTTPQQRTAAEGEDTRRAWVGLTESDRRLINFQWQDGNGTATEIIDLVEAKLKEKNT
jgi:hypothetical protein